LLRPLLHLRRSLAIAANDWIDILNAAEVAVRNRHAVASAVGFPIWPPGAPFNIVLSTRLWDSSAATRFDCSLNTNTLYAYLHGVLMEAAVDGLEFNGQQVLQIDVECRVDCGWQTKTLMRGGALFPFFLFQLASFC
jgi:hypothetical protein